MPVSGDLLLGKYRVERTVGEGGMGVVLAVRHIELDELFAMKVAKVGSLQQPSATARFMREARAAAHLRSHHVAHVYDVGWLPSGLPYMLMEYLEGENLADVLVRLGPLVPERAIAMVVAILDAIVEAHSLGIVHRDLKPENVFLATRPNGDFTVKVLDFGISKLMASQRPQNACLTHPNVRLGSPRYMSPEQMRASRDVDTRADIWAIGVILYELLTGDAPFQGETFTEISASVLGRAATPVELVAAGVPPKLVAIVERCLRPEVSERFQSAAELLGALTVFQSELGLLAEASAWQLLLGPPDASPRAPPPVTVAPGGVNHAAPPARLLAIGLVLAGFAVGVTGAVFGPRGLSWSVREASSASTLVEHRHPLISDPPPLDAQRRSAVPAVEAEVAAPNIEPRPIPTGVSTQSNGARGDASSIPARNAATWAPSSPAPNAVAKGLERRQEGALARTIGSSESEPGPASRLRSAAPHKHPYDGIY